MIIRKIFLIFAKNRYLLTRDFYLSQTDQFKHNKVMSVKYLAMALEKSVLPFS